VGVVMESQREVLMLTEFMANGNLVDFLRSRGMHHVNRLFLITKFESLNLERSIISFVSFFICKRTKKPSLISLSKQVLKISYFE
jgi:hypothetical protein